MVSTHTDISLVNTRIPNQVYHDECDVPEIDNGKIHDIGYIDIDICNIRRSDTTHNIIETIGSDDNEIIYGHIERVTNSRNSKSYIRKVYYKSQICHMFRNTFKSHGSKEFVKRLENPFREMATLKIINRECHRIKQIHKRYIQQPDVKKLRYMIRSLHQL